MKILLIEDEQHLRQSIKESLEKEHYLVETAYDHPSAMEKAMIYHYDIILLDIMLPNGNGLDILKALKKEGKSENVIIISAKDSLDDKLIGLDLGADDYLAKPFHLAELNARIKAVHRRKDLNGKKASLLNNVKLQLEERTCHINDVNIPLNRKEFDMLYYFLLNKERLLTKEALAEHVWGDNVDQADNLDFVYYQIKNLRKKLQESNADIEIESVYGIGYKLTGK